MSRPIDDDIQDTAAAAALHPEARTDIVISKSTIGLAAMSTSAIRLAASPTPLAGEHILA